MGQCVCGGAMVTCTFGMAPAVLNVLPVNRVVTSMPIANIMDSKPIVNIPTFGMCSSPANPVVAAATAAKLGVFTPMPCLPNTVGPWVPGSPTVLIAGQPALNNTSKCMCAWAGVISISFAGQATIQVP